MADPHPEEVPLLEAIFEARWALPEVAPSVRIDPAYKLLPGSYFARVKQEYPVPEQLPSALLPDEAAAYVVQHRFRKTAGGWPLLQLGPGILTLNDTTRYEWGDFRTRTLFALNELVTAYTSNDEIPLESASLRYINAIPCDHRRENVLDFMRSQMGLTVQFPAALFTPGNVHPRPDVFSTQAVFPCQHPPGGVLIKIDNGERQGQSVLRWETAVVFGGPPFAKRLRAELPTWLDAAHQIAEEWFCALTKRAGNQESYREHDDS